MNNLKYTVIKSDRQYDEYCNRLKDLDMSGNEREEIENEIDLLTLLIEDYDRKSSKFRDLDPVELIKSLMEDHKLKQRDIAEIAGVGKSYISEILNYKKTMSREVIRKLADHFKVRQEAFNRPYQIRSKNLKKKPFRKTSQKV